MISFLSPTGVVLFSAPVGKVFLTSDTHFDHQNIINYCNRPFKNVNDMNIHMITEWNKVVKEDDFVIHVGDVEFYQKNFTQYLNGNKFLVKGNHDSRQNIFMKYVNYGTIVSEHFSPILVRHNPINHGPYDFCFHGHLHKSDPNHNNGKLFDVGVDMHNAIFGTFAPFTLKYLLCQKGIYHE